MRRLRIASYVLLAITFLASCRIVQIDFSPTSSIAPKRHTYWLPPWGRRGDAIAADYAELTGVNAQVYYFESSCFGMIVGPAGGVFKSEGTIY